MPVVRNYRTGRPVANAVRPINRSEEIRRIFKDRGNISTGQVIDSLASEGLEASESLIRAQRNKLFPKK